MGAARGDLPRLDHVPGTLPRVGKRIVHCMAFGQGGQAVHNTHHGCPCMLTHIGLLCCVHVGLVRHDKPLAMRGLGAECSALVTSCRAVARVRYLDEGAGGCMHKRQALFVQPPSPVVASTRSSRTLMGGGKAPDSRLPRARVVVGVGWALLARFGTSRLAPLHVQRTGSRKARRAATPLPFQPV